MGLTETSTSDEIPSDEVSLQVLRGLIFVRAVVHSRLGRHSGKRRPRPWPSRGVCTETWRRWRTPGGRATDVERTRERDSALKSLRCHQTCNAACIVDRHGSGGRSWTPAVKGLQEIGESVKSRLVLRTHCPRLRAHPPYRLPPPSWSRFRQFASTALSLHVVR